MLRRAVCLLLLLIVAKGLSAQRTPAPVPNDGTRQPRILLLVDASSSMLQPWSQKGTRFQTAGNIITALMDSIYAVNAGVEFGLRVYGHQSPAQNNDCLDSRQEVMFSKNNVTQMGLRLASLRPYGVSPIAYSLQEAAANDLVDEVRNAYSIILITDGGESCGGNICDVVKQLIERKIYFKPYIISLVDYAPLRQQYECMGGYLQAAKPDEIPVAIKTIVDAYRPLLSAPIMAVKTDTARPKMSPPVVKKDSIHIPAWIPQYTSIEKIMITVPRGELQVPRARIPVMRSVTLPGSAPVSKPPAEPVITPPPVVRVTEPSLMQIAVARSRRSFQTGVYRPIVYPMAVPGTISVSKPPPEPVVIVRKSDTLFRLRPTGRIKALPASPAVVVMARRYAALPLSLPTLAQDREQVALGLIRPSAQRWPALSYALPRLTKLNPYVQVQLPTLPQAREEATLSFVRPVVQRWPSVSFVLPRMSRLNPYVPVQLPVIAPEPRDTVIAVKPTAPPREVPTKTTINIRKIDPPVSTVKPATKPDPKFITKPKETEFVKVTEEAKETSLSILFTDGRGKFYASTPQLQLLDAATGKLVKQFYRTVDASGNPDPQTIPPGTYNLLVAGRANMLMRRVTVEANKLNKVIVKVNNGSLRFVYADSEGMPIDRAVTEYEAIVNIRFEPGPTIRQRCTSELEYAPGNYYIEVNTMPISRFNTDIDFGAITEIRLPQPGFVQFTNTSPKGQVALFAPLGNKFVRFVDVNVTGNPAAQRLMLKPGAYEAHWVKNPNQPYASETVEKFVVQSNAITDIELH